MNKLGYVERPGLYVMVFFCLLNTCHNDSDHNDILNEIRTIEQKQTAAPIPIVEPAIYLPDFCMRDYPYTRSGKEEKQCFNLLFEEVKSRGILK